MDRRGATTFRARRAEQIKDLLKALDVSFAFRKVLRGPTWQSWPTPHAAGLKPTVMAISRFRSAPSMGRHS